MRILLIGHACSPHRGSEHAVTWNWAWHLSEQNEVWLIAHWSFREEVTEFLRIHDRPRLHTRFVDVDPAIDPLDRTGVRMRGVKLHYILWLRAAYSEARRLTSEMPFDIVHQVGWTTINVPSPFWKLGLPFIWGPLGGGQKTPSAFQYLMTPGRLSERVRDLSIRLLPFWPAFRKAVQHSSRIFAVNRDTAAVLHRAGKREVELLLDCGVTQQQLQVSKPRRADERMTVLWGGTIEPRKGLPLAIHAMANLPERSNARLVVAGDGPGKGECQALCQRLGISNRVEFLGSIPTQKMSDWMNIADVFLFTSVRDSFGSVVLEAAAHRLAIVALNQHGIAALLPDTAAMKIPVEDASDTIRELTQAISLLEGDVERRRELGAAAYDFACLNTWEKRIGRMLRVYAEVIAESPKDLLDMQELSEVNSDAGSRAAQQV